MQLFGPRQSQLHRLPHIPKEVHAAEYINTLESTCLNKNGAFVSLFSQMMLLSTVLLSQMGPRMKKGSLHFPGVALW